MPTRILLQNCSASMGCALGKEDRLVMVVMVVMVMMVGRRLDARWEEREDGRGGLMDSREAEASQRRERKG